MKEYFSVKLVSRNEHGVEELTLEEYLTFWQRLKIAIKERTMNPPKTRERVYEVCTTFWVDKSTGMRVDFEIQYECFEARAYMKRMDDVYANS